MMNEELQLSSVYFTFFFVQELGVIVAPKEFAVFDICLRKRRLEGWGECPDELPLLIIYARARGTNGCADCVNDDDAVARDECVASGCDGAGGRDSVFTPYRMGE